MPKNHSSGWHGIIVEKKNQKTYTERRRGTGPALSAIWFYCFLKSAISSRMCVCMQWNLILGRTFSPEQVDIDGFVEQLCGIVYGGRLTTTNETKSNEHANFANCKRWRTRYQADPSSVSAISIPKCSKYTYQAACSSCLRRARGDL